MFKSWLNPFRSSSATPASAVRFDDANARAEAEHPALERPVVRRRATFSIVPSGSSSSFCESCHRRPRATARVARELSSTCSAPPRTRRVTRRTDPAAARGVLRNVSSCTDSFDARRKRAKSAIRVDQAGISAVRERQQYGCDMASRVDCGEEIASARPLRSRTASKSSSRRRAPDEAARGPASRRQHVRHRRENSRIRG